jgi:hypothetical protein
MTERMVDERPLKDIPKDELIKMVEALRSRRAAARERTTTRRSSTPGVKTPRAKRAVVEESNPELDALLGDLLGGEDTD